MADGPQELLLHLPGGTMMASGVLHAYNKWTIHKKQKQQAEALGETRRLPQLLEEKDVTPQETKEMERKIRTEFEEEIQKRDNMIKELANKLDIALRQGEKTENLLAEANDREMQLGISFGILQEELLIRDDQIENLLNEERNWKREKQELEHQIEIALHHGKEMENWYEIEKARADEIDQYLTSREYETKVRDTFVAVEVKKRDEKIEEMANQLEAALHHGKEMENLVEKEKARANEMVRYLSSLREYEKNLRDRFAVEVKNRDEKIQEIADKLQAALHHGVMMENLMKTEKARADEMDKYLTTLREYETTLRDRFAVEVKNRDKKIQETADKLEAALHHGKKLENLLKILKARADEMDRELTSLQKYKAKVKDGFPVNVNKKHEKIDELNRLLSIIERNWST
ncbi:uncharacterized protein [Macrobrachium rosenbergii]|uniref:uncharacterized protein n=1 Tax=Macrobrachium rosenbergii TaxID=79674 RepID=UPI0034D6D3F6